MPEKFISPATLVSGTALIALAAFGFLASGPVERPVGRASVSIRSPWSQETGSGIFVPACGSSGASTSCQGGTTIVNFNWTIDGPAPGPAPGVTCSTAAIKVNGSTIASGLPCSGSYQWNGAAPNTTYNYEVIISTP